MIENKSSFIEFGNPYCESSAGSKVMGFILAKCNCVNPIEMNEWLGRKRSNGILLFTNVSSVKVHTFDM